MHDEERKQFNAFLEKEQNLKSEGTWIKAANAEPLMADMAACGYVTDGPNDSITRRKIEKRKREIRELEDSLAQEEKRKWSVQEKERVSARRHYEHQCLHLEIQRQFATALAPLRSLTLEEVWEIAGRHAQIYVDRRKAIEGATSPDIRGDASTF